MAGGDESRQRHAFVFGALAAKILR
jgi:hypothetical protein